MLGSIDMRVLLIGAIALIVAFHEAPAGGSAATGPLACAPSLARMAGDVTGSIAPPPAAVPACR